MCELPLEPLTFTSLPEIVTSTPEGMLIALLPILDMMNSLSITKQGNYFAANVFTLSFLTSHDAFRSGDKCNTETATYTWNLVSFHIDTAAAFRNLLSP